MRFKGRCVRVWYKLSRQRKSRQPPNASAQRHISEAKLPAQAFQPGIHYVKAIFIFLIFACSMALTLLHTADWHIGRTHNVVGTIHDRLDDQRVALDKLLDLVEKYDPSLILLAGDLYDTPRPRAEAEKLVAQYLLRLTQEGKRLLVAIAGNHDSNATFATYHNWAQPLGILLIGTVQDTLLYDGQTAGQGHTLASPLPGVLRIRLRHEATPIYLYAFPHRYSSQWPQAYELPRTSSNNESTKIDYKTAWHMIPDRFIQENPQAYHIFMGHSFCVAQASEQSEDIPDDEDFFLGGDERHGMEVFHRGLHYVALGHLHRPHQVGNRPIYYPGSLLWYGPYHVDVDRQVILATWDSPHNRPQITFHKLCLEDFQPIYMKTDNYLDIDRLLSDERPYRRALWLKWRGSNHLSHETLQKLSNKYYLTYQYEPAERVVTLSQFESERESPQHYLYRPPHQLLEDFLHYKKWPSEDIQKVIGYIFEKYAHITKEA